MDHEFNLTVSSSTANTELLPPKALGVPWVVTNMTPGADGRIGLSAIALSFAVQLAFTEPSIADFDSRADVIVAGEALGDVLARPSPLLRKVEAVRYLTSEEQQIFHRALRRSVRVVYRAGGPANP